MAQVAPIEVKVKMESSEAVRLLCLELAVTFATMRPHISANEVIQNAQDFEKFVRGESR